MKTKILGNRRRRLEELMQKAVDDPTFKEVFEGKEIVQERKTVKNQYLKEVMRLKHSHPLGKVAFCMDKGLLAYTNTKSNSIELDWLDYIGRKRFYDTVSIKPRYTPEAVACYPLDETSFAAGGSDGCLYIYKFENGKINQKVRKKILENVKCLDFSSYGGHFIASSDKNHCVFCKCEYFTWHKIERVEKIIDRKLPVACRGLSYVTGGIKHFAIAAEQDIIIGEIDYDTEDLVHVDSIPNKANDIAFCSSENFFATAGKDGILRLYRYHSKAIQEIWAQDIGAPLNGIDISARHGGHIAVTCEDKNVYVYEVKWKS